MVILVIGLPGSGKTFFASRLAKKLGAVHLSSDILRRDIGEWNTYTTVSKENVYDALLEKLQENLNSGNTVVIDATFFRRKLREKFIQAANRFNEPYRIIEIKASEKTIKERVSKPRADSQADYEIYQKIKSEFEPVSEKHLILFSDKGPVEDMLAQAEAYLNE